MTAKPVRRFLSLSALSVGLTCGLVSCKSTPKSGYADVVDYTTPQTSLSQEEYPFDEKGNYLADVVSGKRRGSRNKPVAAATPSTASYVDLYEKPPAASPPVVASNTNYETPVTSTSPNTSDVYAPVYSAGGPGSGTTAPEQASSSASARDSGSSSTASSSKAKSRSSTAASSRSTASKSGSTAKSKSGATAKTKAKTKAKPANLRYTVKKGDTLYGLANRYGTSVAAIKKASGLSSNTLRDGRTISIPR